jgi:hypothetical protein
LALVAKDGLAAAGHAQKIRIVIDQSLQVSDGHFEPQEGRAVRIGLDDLVDGHSLGKLGDFLLQIRAGGILEGVAERVLRGKEIGS